jgi:predicted Zn-dependent peptidase
LGDGFTSLLFRELREKRGYAYATTSFYPTRVNMPRLFTYIGTSPQKAQKALEDMLQVTQEYPFGENDVEIAKRKLIGDWLMDHQTRLRQSWYLGWFETIGLGFEMDSKFTNLIKGVSYREVLEVREKFVDHLHQCVVVKP